MDYTPNGYNGNSQGGFEPNSPFYMYTPPGKKFPHFVPHDVWNNEKVKIRRLSVMAGCAVVAFILLSTVYVLFFQGITSLLVQFGVMEESALSAVKNSASFNYLYSLLYSVFVVGVPFFVIGAIAHKKGYLDTIPLGKPRYFNFLPVIVVGAFGICLLGNIITAYLDSFIEVVSGFEVAMPETPDPEKNVLDIFLYFLSTAVVPALIEELIMRGIIMQPLRRYGDWFAILVSSMIFGLMHCNLLQIPFAFIAGVAIGYAVITTESLWTGVLIHFLNNAYSVALSLVVTFCGEYSAAVYICNGLFYVLIAVGVGCAFLYVKKINRTAMKKSPLVNQGKDFIGMPNPFSAKVSNGTLFGTYLATFPMIAAIIAVIYETVVTLVILG